MRWSDFQVSSLLPFSAGAEISQKTGIAARKAEEGRKGQLLSRKGCRKGGGEEEDKKLELQA